MKAMVTNKTGPARRVYRGRLIDGYIEVTSDYIGFRPLNPGTEIGFMQWYEFNNIRILRRSCLRPAAIQVSRTGGNVPLIMCVPDVEAWVEVIRLAHNAYLTARSTQSFSITSTEQSLHESDSEAST